MLFLLKTLIFIEVLMAVGLMLFRWALQPRERALVSTRIVVLAIATPVVALFCANIYLFFFYLAAVVAFNARKRHELAGAYLFLLPLMPMLTIEAQIGGLYLFGLSVTVAMGLGALIGVIATSGRGAPTAFRYDLAMWAMVAIVVFIYDREPTFNGLLRGLATYLTTILGPYYLVSRSMRTRDELETVLLQLCLGATLVALTALFQAWRHWVIFETYFEALHLAAPLGSAAMALRAGFLRSGGAMVDYSAAGLFLAAIVTLLPLLRKHFTFAGFWIVLGTLIIGLLATQSRGAWIAAIVGMASIAAYRGQWTRVLILVGAATAAEVMVLLFLKSGPLAQLLGQTGQATDNVDYRRRLATQGIDQIRAHPVLGQPLNALVANLSDLTQGQHIVDFVNGHLFVAMIAGVPVFLLWCGIWLLPVIEGWRYRRDGEAIAGVPTAMVVPPMIALVSTSIADRNLAWPIVALSLAPACLAFARQARSAHDAQAQTRAPVTRPRLRPRVMSMRAGRTVDT